jgi:hypothetical protein
MIFNFPLPNSFGPHSTLKQLDKLLYNYQNTYLISVQAIQAKILIFPEAVQFLVWVFKDLKVM